MDGVDELDLDDDFFSTAQPMAGISWNPITATTLSSATRPSVAPNLLQQTLRGEQQTSSAASKESNASHRRPLKPLATMLQTPDFSRSTRAFAPPMRPPSSQPAQMNGRGSAYTQNGSLRVTKRPAEGQSLPSSKRMVLHQGFHTAASQRNQPASSMPTACNQPGLGQSGFRQPTAPVLLGPRQDKQGPAQLHSRTVTPCQQGGAFSSHPPSSAVSAEQRAVSTTFLIPGPAGMLQQQMGQAPPATATISSCRDHQQSYPSRQDDFASEAWMSATMAANAPSRAGELERILWLFTSTFTM